MPLVLTVLLASTAHNRSVAAAAFATWQSSWWHPRTPSSASEFGPRTPCAASSKCRAAPALFHSNQTPVAETRLGCSRCFSNLRYYWWMAPSRNGRKDQPRHSSMK